jgi:hypothetical protein
MAASSITNSDISNACLVIKNKLDTFKTCNITTIRASAAYINDGSQCTITDVNPCCGNGVCVANPNLGGPVNVCTCNTGF